MSDKRPKKIKTSQSQTVDVKMPLSEVDLDYGLCNHTTDLFKISDNWNEQKMHSLKCSCYNYKNCLLR
jgi:hypothetical protein